MTQTGNAGNNIEPPGSDGDTLQFSPLAKAVRDSAARAMNEPRFKERSEIRRHADAAPPTSAEPVAQPAANRLPAQTFMVALVSMGAGALMMYLAIHGARNDAPIAVQAATLNGPISGAINALIDAPINAPMAPVVIRDALTPPANARTDAGVAVPAAAIAAVEHPVNAGTEPRAAVAAAIANWAGAWSQRDVDRYLDLYAKEFSPPDKQTRAIWAEKRRERILGKQHIHVVVDDLAVEMLNADRAIARFAQTYEADNYKETRAAKMLILAREDNNWRIAAEMSAPAKSK